MANVRWIISLTVQYNVRYLVLSLWLYPDPCITARSLDPARFNALAPYALALTKPLMPVWIFMLEAFGRDRDLHTSNFGCVTLMQTLKHIYKKHENEKKTQYAKRVTVIEQGTFTPLVFTTTGGMEDECVKYHSRLAELIANKKGESYSSAVSWIRAKVHVFRHRTLCDA